MDAQFDIEALTRSLKAKTAGTDKWTAKCPAHVGKNPNSLSIALKGGKVLVKCFGGCSQDEVINTLRARGLWPEKAKKQGEGAQQSRARSQQVEVDPWDWRPVVPVPDDAPPLSEDDMTRAAPAGSTFTASWAYRGADGRLLGHVARFDNRDEEGTKKMFLPFTLCEAKGVRQWRMKGLAEPRPLYGLELLAARPDSGVIVTEGEKSADAARLRFPDLVSVTSPNGSQSAKKADWTALQGRRVMVWPDNDRAGAAYAADVAAMVMQAGAESVVVVDTAGLPDSWDLADELSEGITDDDLARRLAEAKPPKEIGGAKSSGDARVDTDIFRLARMTVVEYERQRAAAAVKLGIRTGVLDELVKAARTTIEPPKAAEEKETRKKKTEAGSDFEFPRIEPWPQPVNGAELFSEIAKTVSEHVILPRGAADAIALWVGHSHAHDMTSISPILTVTSPVPECGKTTLLNVLGKLVPRPLPSSNVTAATLFRAVDKWRPTLLVDEVDTYLDENGELRGIINSGHNRAAAFVLRCVGNDNEVRRFITWAPKALALIGKLPATTASRSIHIPLQRKLAAEKVKPAREDRMDYLVPLCRRLVRWTIDNETALRKADPALPPGLGGRKADNWRPIIAVADVAGGDWPALARQAVVALTDKMASVERGIMLLSDIRAIFDDRGADKTLSKDDNTRIFSKDLATTLGGMLTRPWPEWKKGKAITDRQVAVLLEPFKISPRNVRIDSEQKKGYERAWFEDAFKRYLDEVAPPGGSPAVTPSQPSNFNDLGTKTSVPSEIAGTDKMVANPLKTKDWDGGTAGKPPQGPVEGEGGAAEPPEPAFRVEL